MVGRWPAFDTETPGHFDYCDQQLAYERVYPVDFPSKARATYAEYDGAPSAGDDITGGGECRIASGRWLDRRGRLPRDSLTDVPNFDYKATRHRARTLTDAAGTCPACTRYTVQLPLLAENDGRTATFERLEPYVRRFFDTQSPLAVPGAMSMLFTTIPGRFEKRRNLLPSNCYPVNGYFLRWASRRSR